MRTRFRSQSGITLIEVTVATTLMAVVGAVFLPLLNTATRTAQPMQANSEAVDSLRNSLAIIGRELRSAVCITAPTANAASGNVLTFSTDANGPEYTVTYTVTGGQLLRQVQGESTVTLVASGLISPEYAFTFMETPRRTVKVKFHFQPNPSYPAKELSTVIAGRNAWHNCS
jgi:type II secretory pathway pseudopilin PulG